MMIHQQDDCNYSCRGLRDREIKRFNIKPQWALCKKAPRPLRLYRFYFSDRRFILTAESNENTGHLYRPTHIVTRQCFVKVTANTANAPPHTPAFFYGGSKGGAAAKSVATKLSISLTSILAIPVQDSPD